ncbi:MAG: DNA double-strand break repair nuclease NurA [Conexivisphaerales archaeon]
MQVEALQTDDLSMLSKESVSFLRGRRIILHRIGQEEKPFLGWNSIGENRLDIVEFSDTNNRQPVASIDSSVIQVAETDEGYVFAAKGCVAYNFLDKKRILMFGPAIYYWAESTSSHIQERLGEKIPSIFFRDPQLAMRALRILLERNLTFRAVKQLRHGTVLIDGSLKYSSIEPQNADLRSIIMLSKENYGSLAGIAKKTKIKELQRLEGLLLTRNFPSFIDVTEVMKIAGVEIAGKSFLAKLSGNAPALRVDISHDEGEDFFSKLISSDAIVNGYPETLRAAHLLSIFSPADEAAVKARLGKIDGLSILPGFNIRHMLLGTLEVKRR